MPYLTSARAKSAGKLKSSIVHSEWYLRAGNLDTPEILRGWVHTQETALARGYKGLRLTGNTHWIERQDWQPFMDYESQVSDTFRPHRIVALCSYCLERCHSEGMLDVIQNHEFAGRRSRTLHSPRYRRSL